MTMSMSLSAEAHRLSASTETRLAALAQWWQRHCQAFCLWMLERDPEEQRALLLKACADLPARSAFARAADGEKLVPTDLLLPEFSLEGMLASQGRIFVLFVTRRLAARDLCMNEDIRMLKDLLERGCLPSFSHQTLEKLDTPFVDPLDPEEKVKSLSPDPPAEARNALAEHFAQGRLIRAEVWLALRIRRMSIATLLEVLAEEHFRAAPTKPSPSYAALLAGELAQQHALLEQAIQQQPVEVEATPAKEVEEE